MRRVLAFLFCLLAAPSWALSPAQEIILLGGSGQSYYASPAATGKLPPWLSYASAGVRYYFDASGNLQTSPNNLLLYSNNLAGAGWAVSGGTLTPGQADPFGGTGAYRLQEASSAALLAGGYSPLVANYIPSIWAKSNTGLSQNWAFWNGAISVPVTITTSWTRVYVAYTGSGASNYVFNFYPVGASGDIIVYGAQAEQVTAAQTTPNPFMPTSGSAYFGPVVNDHLAFSPFTALGLRTEPQRTNLFLNNLAPATQTITVANATQYTVSFYGTGTEVLTGACTTTMTGAAGVRTSYTCTSATTSLVMTDTGLTATAYPQVEANAFATSPILTYGTAVTAAADNWSFTGAALQQLMSGKFCTVVEALAEGLGGGGTPRLFDISDGTTNNVLNAFMASSLTTGGASSINAGVSVPVDIAGGDISTARRRLAMSSFAAGISASYDGSATVASPQQASPQGLSVAILGNRPGGTRAWYGWFSQILIKPSCTATQVKAYSTANSNMSR